MAYRVLREVRSAGEMAWSELHCRVSDPEVLEEAVDWLAGRGLIMVDGRGVQAC